MQHGSGFPAVNGDSKLDLIDPLVPPHLEAPSTPIGPHELGTFTSEFGMYVKIARMASVMASVTSHMSHLCSSPGAAGRTGSRLSPSQQHCPLPLGAFTVEHPLMTAPMAAKGTIYSLKLDKEQLPAD